MSVPPLKYPDLGVDLSEFMCSRCPEILQDNPQAIAESVATMADVMGAILATVVLNRGGDTALLDKCLDVTRDKIRSMAIETADKTFTATEGNGRYKRRQ